MMASCATPHRAFLIVRCGDSRAGCSRRAWTPMYVAQLRMRSITKTHPILERFVSASMQNGTIYPSRAVGDLVRLDAGQYRAPAVPLCTFIQSLGILEIPDQKTTLVRWSGLQAFCTVPGSTHSALHYQPGDCSNASEVLGSRLNTVSLPSSRGVAHPPYCSPRRRIDCPLRGTG